MRKLLPSAAILALLVACSSRGNLGTVRGGPHGGGTAGASAGRGTGGAQSTGGSNAGRGDAGADNLGGNSAGGDNAGGEHTGGTGNAGASASGAPGAGGDSAGAGGNANVNTEPPLVHTDDAGCTWTVRAATLECSVTEGDCPLGRVWELQCPNSFTAPGVVAEGGGLRAAYTTVAESGEPRLVIAKILGDTVSTQAFEDPTDALLVSNGQEVRALSRDPSGIRVLGEDETWTPLVESDRLVNGRLLDDGTLAFLTTNNVEQTRLWLDSESTLLDGADLPTSAGGALLRQSIDGAEILTRWLDGEEVELGTTFGLQKLLEQDGTVLWATKEAPLLLPGLGSTPTPPLQPDVVDRLYAIDEEDVEPVLIFDGALANPAECADRLTAFAPDICPLESTATDLGSVLFPDTVDLVTWGGSPWFGRVQSTLTNVCEWQTLSDCFETLPCDCAQRNNQRLDVQRLLVAPVDAPDEPAIDVNVGWYGAVTWARLLDVNGGLHVAMISDGSPRRLGIYELSLR